MSASTYLIVIIGLAALFAAGVFVGAKLEFSNPPIATFAYRVGLLSGYAAGMVAVGWVMYDLVIPQMEKVAAVIGDKAMFFSLFTIWVIGAVWVINAHRRYNQRQRSGKFLEPREP